MSDAEHIRMLTLVIKTLRQQLDASTATAQQACETAQEACASAAKAWMITAVLCVLLGMAAVAVI